MKKKLICIEGPFGAGKTEVAEALAPAFDAKLCLDAKNPFLHSFYDNMDQYAFQVQLFFLLSRFQQQKEFSQSELFRPTVLSDYLFQKDRLFASLTLEAAEFALYEKVYSMLNVSVPPPDLVVYLQKDLESIMKTLEKKDEKLAIQLDRGYVENVIQAYQTFFQHYNQCPVIVLSSQNEKFIEDPMNVSLLERKIREVDSGTHYLQIGE
ncbi:MAG: deoxynucleoside kinase [Bdellovibrionales bacterium]|nr:deoxynucleoside kinase [Bdellovibrionales bacterium]